MKRLVYACVLTLSVAPFVNCAPKDKVLRQANTKDPDVTEMEIAKVSGLDYTYYLSARAAEAKQLLELALSKNMRQPEKSCVDILPRSEINGEETFWVVANCSYESGSSKIDLKSTEKFVVKKDKEGIYEVELSSLLEDSAAMVPKDKKDKTKNISFSPTNRIFEASRSSDAKKGEQVFDFVYQGNMTYKQEARAGKITTEEVGKQTFTLRGTIRRMANGKWTLSSSPAFSSQSLPFFDLDIKAVRTLVNKKKKNEKVTPKDVSVRLKIDAYKAQQKAENPLLFVGECDRLDGQISIASYDHQTSEKGFTGLVGIDESVMAVKKSGAVKNLPNCEKRMGGYGIQTPLDAIYLK